MAATSLAEQPTHPTPALVRAELSAICGSPVFAGAPRLQKLLAFLVDQTLAGNPLKESIIGVAVFLRDPGYDPKEDSIVRGEARRLRSKLIEYYAAADLAHDVIIDLPKGTYVPVFRVCETPAPIPAPPVRTHNRVVGAVGISVLLALIVAAYELRPTPVRTDAPRTTAARRSVAVLDFRNLTARPESGWLASAIPEMIGVDLAGGGQVRMIPGENISRMESELALHQPDSPSLETLSAIRRNLGADIVISGAYTSLGNVRGGALRVDIRAQDAHTGDLIASVSENGTEPALLDVIARAGTRLRTALQLPAATDVAANLRASSPRIPAAAQAYSDGLAYLRRGDLLAARELLRRSIAAEPDFAPAHAALASAESKLGYETLAREEGKRAYDLSQTLGNAEQKLALEAQYRMVNHEYQRAAELYQRLFADHPDDIEYGLLLAHAQTEGSQTRPALGTIERLRKLPDAESSDPRVDLEAARAYAAHADFRRAAELASEAARKASLSKAALLRARALSYESGVLTYLGDAHWQGLSQEARNICEQFQDQACVASILRRLGNASLIALDAESAEKYFAQALPLARRIGYAGEELQILNGMAMAREERGQLNQSAEDQKQIVSLSRTIRNRGSEQQSLANLGEVFLLAGSVQAARENEEAALKIAREIDYPTAVSSDLMNLASIYRMQGNLAQSGEAGREALGVARKTGFVSLQVAALEEWARVLLVQDDVAGAQATLREADALHKAGDISAFSDPLLPARAALSAHKAAESATLARAAADAAAKIRSLSRQAAAEAVLAQALLAVGETGAARTAVQQAWAQVERSQYRLIAVEVGIARTRVLSDARGLPALIAEARSRQAYELELQGRLVLAELSRDGAGLAALRTEARNRGYRFLARY
jgi:Tfp pilus assembly protein PilF/TolB-like protein